MLSDGEFVIVNSVEIIQRLWSRMRARGKLFVGVGGVVSFVCVASLSFAPFGFTVMDTKMKSNSSEGTKNDNDIPEWVKESGVTGSFRKLPYAIAIISTPHGQVGIYSNPTDQRCYRMIARLVIIEEDDDPSMLCLNEFHSLEESLAVATAVAVIKQVLYRSSAHLFVQSLHLGNNSMYHETDDTSQGNKIGLGKAGEPYFYHEHLLLRGDPAQTYFAGASALGGPPLGTAFAAQGSRVRPQPEQLAAIVQGLKKILKESCHEDAEETDVWKQSNCVLEVIGTTDH